MLHFQYLNWPDHGIPPTTTGLLKFYKTACSAQPANAGPMLVHCSKIIVSTFLKGSTVVIIANVVYPVL